MTTRSVRTSVLATVVTTGLGVGLGVAATPTAGVAATGTGAPPSLLAPVPADVARAAGDTAPRDVVGAHRLVTLDTGALPARADGQRLRVPLGDGTSTIVRITSVELESAYTAWTGSLDGERLGSFSLVEADGVYRGAVVSPDGVYALTQARGDRYWLTDVAPRRGAEGDDAAPAPQVAAAPASPSARAKRKEAKIGVMFAFTKAAKAAAGTKAALKASAALVITQTNEALRNSGIKAKLKYKGLVKTKGKESPDAVKNAFRVSKPHDGHFDNLQRVRRRHGGDIVHLFTVGDPNALCGGGLIPVKPSWANPRAGASTTFLGCLPYLVATHEIGHNLGADHIDYPGISHHSKTQGAYGYYNVPGNYISVMSYYDPCTDNGVFTCVRIPYFSSPTNTYNGQPLGLNKATDNARVIKKFAPRVARYVH